MDLRKNPDPDRIKNPDLELLVEEEKELEALQSKKEFEEIRIQEEREMGILFVDVDNSYDLKHCRDSPTAERLESCLNFCHRYNFWYFDGVIFRDIHTMYEMFHLVVDKIIGEEMEYKASPPDPKLQHSPGVQFKYEQYNFMSRYGYIYGRTGVALNHFIGDV